MNKAEKACSELQEMDELASRKSCVHRLSPLSKLLVTVIYIAVVLSFDKYDIGGLFNMVLFPVVGYQLSTIEVWTCFRKLRIVLPLVCAVGVLNPFFDPQTKMVLAGIEISGGLISMLTLMMKGVFSLMASFLLVATTPIESICGALRRLHVPRILTTLILLTYRYIGVLLEELSIMQDAYHLRSSGQKGIRFSAWGSFLGQLLLRSIDRAQSLYESMILRGFHGEFDTLVENDSKRHSPIFFVVCSGLIILFRFFNVTASLSALFS